MEANRNLLLTIKDQVLTITVNRESKLNAINRETLHELESVFLNEVQDKAIRGVIITGSGPKAFIAGADIKEFSSAKADDGRRLAEEGHRIFNLIEGCNKPVIAAINGYALGGGLELALACHIRTASDTAMLGLPEINLGLIPGYGGTQRLTLLAGKGRAAEMTLSAKMISASDALAWGLVNLVTEPSELIAKTENLMQRIISGPPLAIAAAIRAINAAADQTTDGFSVEINEFNSCFGTEDFKEGIKAFSEKRQPVFQGK